MKRPERHLLLAALLLLAACSGSDPDAAIDYRVPQEVNDGITVGSAIDMGLDVGLLSQIKTKNTDGTYNNVHSILVAVDNQLVYEEYFPGKPIYEPFTQWDKDRIHRLHSVTKSFNSALIGIAVDQFGLSIDTPVKDFFPEMDESNWEGMKSDITVEHLLTMSSGLQWDEWSFSYDDPRNDHHMMNNSDNWVHFVLERPMATVPGTQFLYNSGLSITLGEIIRRKTGQGAGLFARDHLFQPMGIDNIIWDTSNSNIFQTGGGLRLRPRDMMKFGLLFLNKGVWNGQRLVSADWVEASSQPQGPNRGYTYQWWLISYFIDGGSYSGYFAGGRGGQYIVILEQLNMVVVFTAGNDNALASSQPREMMEQYILPAVQNRK